MKKTTIPSFQFEDTSDPNIKRFCDRNGDWTHYWLVKEKRFVKAVNHVLSLGYNKGPRFAQYLLSVTKEEAQRKLTTAGDEGTRTHRAIGDLIKGNRVTLTTKYPSELVAGRQETLNDEEWDNLQAFENWCAVYRPRVVAIEQTVSGGDFAGTFDALMVITVPSADRVFKKEYWGKDVLILVDWKSSAAIYDEYKAQLAAYWEGIRVSHKWDNFAKAYPGRCFSGVVRVGTKHKARYEFEIWDSKETAENGLLFQAAQMIANASQPTFEPEVEQIPTEFFIKVPKAVVVKPKASKTKKGKAKVEEEQGELPLGDK